jgi:hypothetical protein
MRKLHLLLFWVSVLLIVTPSLWLFIIMGHWGFAESALAGLVGAIVFGVQLSKEEHE